MNLTLDKSFKLFPITLRKKPYMDKFEEVEALVQEITEEATNFKNAADPNEEVEALKDLLDVLMRGSKQVVEKIDQYNDRRYR